jgi:hypothetical protein
VAAVGNAHDAEGSDLGPRGTRPGARDPRVRQRPSPAQHLVFVSDAGPWGAWRSRELMPPGDDGWVVAPSWLPPPAGDRVTPARREAVPWARRRRSGALPPGAGPTVEDAASRALSRARAETRPEVPTAPLRRHAVLRRPDRRYRGLATGGPAPRRWRSAVGCPTPAPPSVLPA